jgi:hypothetical protein
VLTARIMEGTLRTRHRLPISRIHALLARCAASRAKRASSATKTELEPSPGRDRWPESAFLGAALAR